MNFNEYQKKASETAVYPEIEGKCNFDTWKRG